MKPIAIPFAAQASAATFINYYHEIWDLPSIISFGSLVISAGYLIVNFLGRQF
ncbi:hypothetical protein OMO38_12855 [Chryseobacterium sp. 09-1422]|uniref:Uncharacterized protein n=1 Tax=Chryseobacterium kimseyorum TaxID=2984028 RepID=A0ABT3I023_9FLAO|nr:hypothetical protein [Chryseobacterium kimseyorum]MCW3169410.1 hypothetical protein [Chryseobacterium kimseyorum]